ncbi:alpha/beta hydrolase [Inquilinus limosus]|uniref:alpha/beta hydrolase n=1 Tax=Inquilinus limosus TaxID=171674 RepID=UPI003F15D272
MGNDDRCLDSARFRPDGRPQTNGILPEHRTAPRLRCDPADNRRNFEMIRVYFATNRAPNSRSNPTDFTADQSNGTVDELWFGWADLTADGAVKNLSVPRGGDAQGRRHGVVETFDTLRQQIQAEPAEPMFFVHGFANTFRSALARAAQLAGFYQAQGGPAVCPFAFCWPSRGVVIDFGSLVGDNKAAYRQDRDAAQRSGPACGEALVRWSNFAGTLVPSRRRILLAHSMGNWALRNGVQYAVNHLPMPPRLAEETILAAADEDFDTLTEAGKLRPLCGLSDRVTVYVNRRDFPLWFSWSVMANPLRLGRQGPSLPDGLGVNVAVVNCSPVVPTDQADLDTHQYYRRIPRVAADIVQVLGGTASAAITGRRPDGGCLYTLPFTG